MRRDFRVAFGAVDCRILTVVCVCLAWSGADAQGPYAPGYGAPGRAAPPTYQAPPYQAPPAANPYSAEPRRIGAQPVSAPASQASVAQPASTAPQLVAGVRIVGNETITDDTVMSYLRTRRDREFDPETLEADARRLAGSNLFRGPPRISTLQVDSGVLVTFQVTERPTIRYLKFHGNRGISDKALLKQSGLTVGDPLNLYAIQEGRRKVEEFYKSKGFGKAQVSVMEGNEPSHRGVILSIAEGPLQRVARVTFVGNTIASDARLRTQIESKPGYLGYFLKGRVDYAQIEADVERVTAYYRALGYFRARVGRVLDFDDDGKWLTIRFVIDEGPRYRVRNVTIVGNERFGGDALASTLELQSGDHFNQSLMNKDLTKLKEAYTGRGHIYAEVAADLRFLLEESGQTDLIYSITEGERFRVGRINVHISGETPHTRESVVLDRLSVRPGDIVDLREIQDSERRLKASQLFLVDPATGKEPEVRIRPPDLEDAEMLAGRRGPTARGQSPSKRRWPKVMNLDVFVTPRKPTNAGARR